MGHYLLLYFVVNSVFESKSYKKLCVAIGSIMNSPVPTRLEGLFPGILQSQDDPWGKVPLLIIGLPSKPILGPQGWWGRAVWPTTKPEKQWWPGVASVATHNPSTSTNAFHLFRYCKAWGQESSLISLLFSFLFLPLFEALVVPRKSFPWLSDKMFWVFISRKWLFKMSGLFIHL